MSLKVIPVEIKKPIQVTKKEPEKVEKTLSEEEVFVSEIAKSEKGDELLENLRHYIAIEMVDVKELIEANEKKNEKVMDYNDPDDVVKENDENKRLKI